MFDSLRDSSPKKMAKGIHKLLDQADAVVHYNGTSFDIPTLNRDFLLHGLNPPSGFDQIDLLRTVRRRFRFMSNKLGYVLKDLGMDGKKDNGGMATFIGCMKGDAKAWAVMEKYNKQDVLAMEPLYERLLPWIPTHPNRNNIDGKVNCCPKCAGDKLQHRGWAHTQTGRYRRFQCTDCGSWSKSAVKVPNHPVTIKGAPQ